MLPKSTQISQKSLDSSWLISTGGASIPSGVVTDIQVIGPYDTKVYLSELQIANLVVVIRLAIYVDGTYEDVLEVSTTVSSGIVHMTALMPEWRGSLILGAITPSYYRLKDNLCDATHLPEISPMFISFLPSGESKDTGGTRLVIESGGVVRHDEYLSGDVSLLLDSRLCITSLVDQPTALLSISDDYVVPRGNVSYFNNIRGTAYNADKSIVSINGFLAGTDGAISIDVKVHGELVGVNESALSDEAELSVVVDTLQAPTELIADTIRLDPYYEYRPTDNMYEAGILNAAFFEIESELVLDDRFDITVES